jgi:hypothetical protein
MFCRVFELPSPRSAQKRDKNKSRKKSVLDFLSIYFKNVFDMDFLQKWLCGLWCFCTLGLEIAEPPLPRKLRNAQKRTSN